MAESLLKVPPCERLDSAGELYQLALVKILISIAVLQIVDSVVDRDRACEQWDKSILL